MIKQRLETIQNKRPEALESLRNAQFRLDPHVEVRKRRNNDVNMLLSQPSQASLGESGGNQIGQIQIFDDPVYYPKSTRAVNGKKHVARHEYLCTEMGQYPD